MGKPEVAVRAPSHLFAGQEYTFDIDVITDGETKIDRIVATVVGTQGWRIGHNQSRVTARAVYPELQVELMADGVLPAATTTRFSARFALPGLTPPTHSLAPAWARLDLLVRISIPWGLDNILGTDARFHYPLIARVPAPPQIERTPIAIRSTRPNESADKPRIELALASTRLVAGETVRGSCAVFHLDDKKPREVELSLVPQLALFRGGRTRERRGAVIEGKVTLPAGSAGTAVPFAFQLPAKIVPTFRTVTHEVSWWLVAMSGGFFGGRVDVSVPLEIVDASAAVRTERLAAPPRLADERIATTFARFAASAGWRGADDGSIADDQHGVDFAVEHVAGAARLMLAYSYRGEEGSFVIARVTYPSLGLDLAVVPSSTLRHVFFADVEVDIAAWDRAHHVDARSAEQAIPFLQAVVPTLMQCGRLGALARWDDDALTFERPMSAIEESELAAAAGELALVADAIADAMPAIGPPAGIAVDVAAWQRLAEWLDAPLCLGELSIEGALSGQPVSIALAWNEGKPERVRVAVGDPESASADLRAITLALAAPARDALGVTSPLAIASLASGEPLAARLVGWAAEFVDLHIADGVATAAYVLGADADASRVRALVEELRTVRTILDPSPGPYR